MWVASTISYGFGIYIERERVCNCEVNSGFSRNGGRL